MSWEPYGNTALPSLPSLQPISNHVNMGLQHGQGHSYPPTTYLPAPNYANHLTPTNYGGNPGGYVEEPQQHHQQHQQYHLHHQQHPAISHPIPTVPRPSLNPPHPVAPMPYPPQPHSHHSGQVMLSGGQPPQQQQQQQQQPPPPHAPHPAPYPLKLPTNSPVSAPLTPSYVPHTPQGAPVSNPFGEGGVANGQEHDLPPELLALGWRKFWSKRENRWYFWNCLTSESLWEVPPIPGRQTYDALSDPLGITSNGPTGVHAGLKRRASSTDHMGSPVVKKFILAGPWDLEVVSNAWVGSSTVPQPYLFPVNPDVEQSRAKMVIKLRSCYQQSCHSREGIDAPKESLNRWLMERKVHDLKGLDPIFPANDSIDGVVSQVMLKEIMNDIPMKVVKPRFTGDARKQLAKFAEACKRTIETRSETAEARKVVKWKVEETFQWLKSTVGSSYEAFQERMAHLKKTCQPHVHAAALSSVEGICKKISTLAKQYAVQVRETHLKLFIEPNMKPEVEAELGRFRCHPALCGTYQLNEATKVPTIEFLQQDRDHAILKLRNDPVRITTQFLQKLEQLYRYNCVDDKKFENFLVRSYCLLKRYNAYTEDFTFPHNMQGSLPVPVFESIQRNFGVTFECFSSPLNCYFRQFCSAFPDTDGYFGSRGNFLDFYPIAGSFQVNPPFSEDLIDAAISHIEELLGGTREPMSFIIFLPEQEDKGEGLEFECQWMKRMESSRWKRRQVTIPAFEHEFRHGAQHMVSKNEVVVRSSHPTVIFWLQNDGGFGEWEPTEQRVDALIDAYRPGRERERDRQELLSPERQNPHQADKAVAAAAAAASAVAVLTPAAAP